MILDHAIVIAALAAVFMALYGRVSLFAALLILSSHIFSLLVLPSTNEWFVFESWLYMLIIKDLALISLFGFMRGRHCFIIMLTFVATCVFHQLILAQALTGKVDNLTLLALRPDLMKFIVICQLSTVYHAIITGGADDGGGLAKCDKFFLHYRLGFIFHKPSFKVKR